MALLWALSALAADPRPNILLIMAEDLSPRVGAFGDRSFDVRIVNASEYHAGPQRRPAEVDGKFLAISLREGTAVQLVLSFLHAIHACSMRFQ